MAAGKLHVVSTPIGNLSDITKRAIDVLGSVSFILAEDTRVTAKLMHSLGIHTPLVSYHKFNERERVDETVQRLRDGENAALVSDAGTPVISDPGHVIVKGCADAGIEVVSVPGPSSVTAALSISGFDASRFVFMGFMAKKEKEISADLKEASGFAYPAVWFESPERIEKTLRCIKEALPQTQICVIKEITKVYERVFRGTASSILNELTEDMQKGEFIIVTGPGSGAPPEATDERIEEMLRTYIVSGMSKSDAIKAVTDELNCNKNRVYRLAHKD